jgi:hypothetical protein
VGTLDVKMGQVIVNVGGALAVTGSVTNQGTLRLPGDAQLTVGGQFVNNGVLDIMTWSGTLPPNFVNNGVVLDHSAIKIESCAIQGQTFSVKLEGYEGHAYQLLYSSNLASSSWTNVGPPRQGNQASLVFTNDMAGGQGRGFYRVAVDPPGK